MDNRGNFRTMILALALPALLLLGGCTAGFKTMSVQDMPPEPTLPFDTIRLEVKPALAEDATEQLTDLEVALVDLLKQLDGVTSVVLESPQSTKEHSLLIRVEVSNLRKVSEASRFFFGSLAGKAKMTADVTFYRGEEETPVGIYKIVGNSGGSGFSGGTDDAVKQTAKAVVDIVARTYNLVPPERPRPPEDNNGI